MLAYTVNCVCTVCDCELLGVIDNDTMCNSDTGQCRCKADVTGLRCDVCVDGYFGLLTSEQPGTCIRQLQPSLTITVTRLRASFHILCCLTI